MNFKEFERLIGKNIVEVNHILKTDFKNDFFENNFYYSHLENSKTFYTLPYNTITLVTSENIVSSITLHFSEVVNRDFYDSFIIDYGFPEAIQVVDSKKMISKIELKEKPFTQKLTKSEIKLREGTFEEKPLFIIWKKRNYQIKIFIRYEQNTSEITFSLLNE